MFWWAKGLKAIATLIESHLQKETTILMIKQDATILCNITT
jgi:hypothetical protein